MKQKATGSRILALLLAVTLLASLVIPAAAAGRNDLTQLAVEQIDNDLVTAQLPGQQQQQTNAAQEETHAASDMVRVSIVLEKKSTLEAGYTAQEVTDSARAMSYRESLQAQQETLSRKISRVALDGQKLDVVWNLTLATNVISANVPYGAIEKIAAMDGVKSVVEEQRYEPQAVSADGNQGTYEPQMGVAGEMTGAHQAWQNGYTGAGMRVAVIDTGLDTNHQSFDPDAQILVMKVFGANGGAYDSDIMAAMEDALVLGADAINLSLGSSVAGRTESDEPAYVALFERLVETDTVVTISAGNYGYWAENTAPGQLYRDGINYATGGSPGSYTNAYTVASLDNDGTISPTFKLNGASIGLTESLSGSAGAYTNASIAAADRTDTWSSDNTEVATAAANGIVNGYADGTFQPDQTISREQMAAILYRYAQYKGCDVSVGEDTNLLSYTDVAQVASYAVPAFQWAVGAGIINGTTATTLSPKGSATRGQVAAILHRYCEWIG